MVKALEAFGQVSLILLSFLVLVCSSVSEYYSLHLITDPSFSLDYLQASCMSMIHDLLYYQTPVLSII